MPGFAGDITVSASELGSCKCHRTSGLRPQASHRHSCLHSYTPVIWPNDPWNRALDLRTGAVFANCKTERTGPNCGTNFILDTHKLISHHMPDSVVLNYNGTPGSINIFH